MARSFNGAASDHVAWSGGPILYNQTAYSIACWFKKDTMTASGGFTYIFDQQSAFNKRVDIYIGDGTAGSTLGKIGFGWRTPTANAALAASTSRWDDGSWHRLLLVRRNTSPFVELYVDGVSDGSSTTDPSTDATAIAGNRWGDNFQGGDINAFGSNGNGSLGRCMLVAKTLSAGDGDNLLNYRAPIKLALHLEMGVASPEPDWSGNGLSGTVTGAASVADGPWFQTATPAGTATVTATRKSGQMTTSVAGAATTSATLKVVRSLSVSPSGRATASNFTSAFRAVANPWPTVTAPSANNWSDHFPGSSLDSSKWGTIVSGTGAASVTDSYVDLNTGGTSAAAALYYKTQLDKTKSQLILAAISFPTGGVAGFSPYAMAVANGASAPVADTKANWDAKIIAKRAYSNQSSLAILDQYYSSAGTATYWDGQGGSPAWTTSFAASLASQMPVRDDDYYVCGLEIDGPNSRFRFVGWGQSFTTPGTYQANQGWRMFALTDWVSWSSARSSSNIWLVFGTPFTDDTTAAHEMRVEWVRYAEAVNNTYIDGWACAKDVVGGIAKVRHVRSVDGLFFVQEDRTTWAIDTGAGGSWDESVIQEPRGVTDGTTDYLFYTGTNAGGTQAFGVATAAHASPQNGPWTKSGSNPILQVGGAGATDEIAIGFHQPFYDPSDLNASKRWKMLYSGKKSSDGKWRTHLATAPGPTGPWTKQGVIIDVGASGADDENAARDAIVTRYGNQYEIHYGGWDAANVNHYLVAWGTDLAALTKRGTFWSPRATAGDQALTANMSSAPGRTVTVADTSGFVVDAPVAFSQSTDLSTFSTSKVRRIASSTSLELYHGVTGFTTAYPARIKQIDFAPNMSPRVANWDGTRWALHINSWEPYFHTAEAANYACVLEEGYFYAVNSVAPSAAPPTIDYLSSPTASRGFNNEINSFENLSLMGSAVSPSVIAAAAGQATTSATLTLVRGKSVTASAAGAATTAVALSVKRLVTTRASGVAAATPAIQTWRNVVASSSGSASTSVTLRVARSVSASSAGQATASLTAVVRHCLVVSISGQASTSVTLKFAGTSYAIAGPLTALEMKAVITAFDLPHTFTNRAPSPTFHDASTTPMIKNVVAT